MTSTHCSGWLIGLSLAGSLLIGAGVAPVTRPPTPPTPADARAPVNGAPEAEKEFNISDGYYVEVCSCKPPCPCELTGAMMGCKGVGAYHLTSASYNGIDLSGVEFAYSLYLGESVIVYLDVKDAKQHDAANSFVRAALAGFGPVKAVKDAKVEIGGKDGAFQVTVDGGKIMSFETQPVLGGDKKTPIVHSNTHDALNPIMYQGTCVSCTVTDGDIKINLDKGRNSYFNQHMKSGGKI